MIASEEDAEWRFASPYLPLTVESQWLRGNHHGHSTRSDGESNPFDDIEIYERAGYQYFALSEHDLFVPPHTYAGSTKMILLPAVEVTSAAGQTLMYLGAGPDIPGQRQASMAQIAEFVHRRGGLFIVDHPNWLYRPSTIHADRREIAALTHPYAVEIYTGVIERMAGSPFALDVWDALLSSGRRVFGHAVDDQHAAVDRFLGWNSVQWPVEGIPASATTIIETLRHGRFYASTGVTFSTLGVSPDGLTIKVESDAKKLRWIVRDGILGEVTSSGKGELDVRDLAAFDRIARLRRERSALSDLIYVRVEAIGDEGVMAWSQPFFIEPA